MKKQMLSKVNNLIGVNKKLPPAVHSTTGHHQKTFTILERNYL
jgi:hypothetical protein